jgi:starch phosphorylase
MKPLSRLHIIPALPEKLTPLWDLSYNLWWTWNQTAIRALQQIDPDAWIACERNPLRFLASLSQEQLEALAQDAPTSTRIQNMLVQFNHYQSRPTWFDQQHAGSNMQVAYFSAEFGLTDSLRIYSGGLAVLAGDHLKSASDLGVPLVGVGLFYREGYFRQALNPDGWQMEHYPENDVLQMPVRPVVDAQGEPLIVAVPFVHGPVHARLWKVQVGRVTLYLLDTDLEENRPEDRLITARLYGGDAGMRIRQEILLGIGGLRALEAMDIQPTICHINEGHSAFLTLERIRKFMKEQGLSFAAAREVSTVGNVFTTHTPVAAGNDWFAADQIEAHLRHVREELGLSREEFLGLGRLDPNNHHSDFCMTVLALRLSARANGVSRLHGQVTRRMWAGLWPHSDKGEIPIGHVTNGVHLQTWAALEIADLYDRYLGEEWRFAHQGMDGWHKVYEIPDRELWDTHQYRRQRLLDFARYYLRNQMRRQGMPAAKIDLSLQSLDPQALTIGFARRFATYKRGTLLFRHLKRLAALFSDPERPLQILFAGKAHPHDNPGKELIRQIVHLARQEPFNGRVFFLEDYDMNVARYLVQGCDVWLNTPRRPLEASGTSGMKAAFNGVLNISVLDGWWEEACELHAGWTIGLGELYDDENYQDEVESNALYDLLETEVIPLFYARDAEGLPRGWIARMKEAIAALAPFFNTNRVVRQYVEDMYLPGQERWEIFAADRQRLERLTQWKSQVRARWPQVRIEEVVADFPGQLKVGMQVPLRATVALGELAPQDVRVELYAGRLNAQHEFQEATAQPLALEKSNSDGRHAFAGTFTCSASGSYGYTLRVVPHHPDLRDPLEMGLVHWASP